MQPYELYVSRAHHFEDQWRAKVAKEEEETEVAIEDVDVPMKETLVEVRRNKAETLQTMKHTEVRQVYVAKKKKKSAVEDIFFIPERGQMVIEVKPG